MDNINQNLDPNFIPEDLKTPYDILELPSQGILYKNKQKSVKVEYLTAMDESILTSPNISSGNRLISILLKRKVKDLGFDVEDLLEGDRTAIMIFLRATSFGEEYKQLVWDEKKYDYVEGIVDLSKLEQKKLTVKPDDKGEFEFTLPKTNKKITFTLLTGRDDESVELRNSEFEKRSGEGVSNKILFRLEQQVKSIDGNRDKIMITNILQKLPIIDSRSLKKYIDEITPGINFNTVARIHGGESVNTFLRFNASFFWPEL